METDRTHEAAIYSTISRMFKGYPGSSNTDSDTIKEYCRQFAKYPPAFLSRIVDSFLHGEGDGKRNSEFVPSIETISKRIMTTSMTADEESVYRQMRGFPPAIEHQPEPEPRRTIPNKVRSSRQEVVERFEANPGMRERVLEGTPIGRRIERLKTMHSGRKVIAEGITLEKFREGAAQHKWGVGASYVPLLQTVYEAKEKT